MKKPEEDMMAKSNSWQSDGHMKIFPVLILQELREAKLLLLRKQ
jgi:hypothetical protein